MFYINFIFPLICISQIRGKMIISRRKINTPLSD